MGTHPAESLVSPSPPAPLEAPCLGLFWAYPPYLSHVSKTRRHLLMRVTNDRPQAWEFLSTRDGSPVVTSSLITHTRAECLTQPRRPTCSFGNPQRTLGKPAQSPGSRVGKPGLGVCSCEGHPRLKCLCPLFPSPTTIGGCGVGWVPYDAKGVFFFLKCLFICSWS